MLIGSLGLGMLLGMITGVVALIIGQSWLTALLLYASVGMVTTVATAIGLHTVRARRNCPGKIAESRSVQ